MFPVHLPSCPTPPKAPSIATPWQGAQPKVLATTSHDWSCSQSQTRPEGERPDPGKYPHWWIADKISWPSNPHPHWWREIKASGRTSLGACIVQEGHNDPVAQHFALWQVAVLRLPVVQQQSWGWWDALPMLHGLHLQAFFPPAPDPQNFQIIRQEKTLPLAWVLQLVQRHQGPKQAFSVEQLGSFSCAWPL